MDIYFTIAFITFALLICLLLVVTTVKNGISPMPTSPKVKRYLLSNLPKPLTGPFLDLGSGWGTITRTIAKKYPSCLVIGYENSLVPYLYSRLMQWLVPRPNLRYIYGDFLKANLPAPQLIFCYLCPPLMKQLQQKCIRQLPPGVWIACHTFSLPAMKPHSTITVPDIYKTKIYLYKTI